MAKLAISTIDFELQWTLSYTGLRATMDFELQWTLSLVQQRFMCLAPLGKDHFAGTRSSEAGLKPSTDTILNLTAAPKTNEPVYLLAPLLGCDNANKLEHDCPQPPKQRRNTRINSPASIFQYSLIWSLYGPYMALYPLFKGPPHPCSNSLESTAGQKYSA